MEAYTEPIRLVTSEQVSTCEDISPFDVPKSMIAFCNPGPGTLEVQFRYIPEEPTVPLSPINDREAKIALGKNSHRIYSLLLQLSNLEDFSHIQQLLLQAVVKIFPHLSDSVPQKDLPSANYNVIRDLIISNSDSLIEYTKRSFPRVYA